MIEKAKIIKIGIVKDGTAIGWGFDAEGKNIPGVAFRDGKPALICGYTLEELTDIANTEVTDLAEKLLTKVNKTQSCWVSMGKIFTSKSSVLGAVAKYAVSQSPYHRPDNLEIVLDRLNDRLKLHFDDQPMGIGGFGDGQLYDILHIELANIPEYVAWNERKNGNDAPLQFTSRYDTGGNPDDDFIDLDALERNVVNEIEREQE